MKKKLIIGLCVGTFFGATQTKPKKKIEGIGSNLSLRTILPQTKTIPLKKDITPAQSKIITTKQAFSKPDLKSIKDKFKTITYRKDASNLSEKELSEVIEISLKLGWSDKALMYTEKLIARSKDSITVKKYKLIRSDILFEKGSLESALTAYTEYDSLYPGSEHAEYVQYKKILCSFYQTRPGDRDQGPTRETLKLTDAYLEKGKVFSSYKDDIKEIKNHCLGLLYENEAHVFEYYLNNKSFKSADKRLAFMKKEFNKTIPESQANLLQLECRLAYAQGDTERYNSRLALLEKRFPHYISSTRVAQASSKKIDYVSKF